MSRVEHSIQIAAPRARVWEAATDPRRLGEWVTIHRDLEKVSGLPLREGSTMRQKLCLRGASFHVEWTVSECREGELLVWEGKGPARSKAHTAYRLADDGSGGTRFDYENEFKAPFGPLGAVAGRALVGGLPEREAHASLQRLKALLER